jgi:ribosomal protein S24E
MEQNPLLVRKEFGLCTFHPRLKNQNREDVTSRILNRAQGATKKYTSETLILQRYFEITPSVNRTGMGYTRKITIRRIVLNQ